MAEAVEHTIRIMRWRKGPGALRPYSASAEYICDCAVQAAGEWVPHGIPFPRIADVVELVSMEVTFR